MERSFRVFWIYMDPPSLLLHSENVQLYISLTKAGDVAALIKILIAPPLNELSALVNVHK